MKNNIDGLTSNLEAPVNISEEVVENKTKTFLKNWGVWIALWIIFILFVSWLILSTSAEDKQIIKDKNLIQNIDTANKISYDLIKLRQDTINKAQEDINKENSIIELRNKEKEKAKNRIEKAINKYNPLGWLLPKTYADDTEIPKDLKVSKWKIRVYKTSNNNLINASLEWNNRWHLITVYDRQIEIMQHYWYSKTRILDLLALRSMECNLSNWKCKWLNNQDIWPFQINIIHTENYNKSLELWNDEEKLFKYQLKVANDLLNSYEKNFCWEKHFKAIWKTYNNEERFKCYARCFNWWPNRVSYAKRWLVQREIVKYFYNNNYKN